MLTEVNNDVPWSIRSHHSLNHATDATQSLGDSTKFPSDNSGQFTAQDALGRLSGHCGHHGSGALPSTPPTHRHTDFDHTLSHQKNQKIHEEKSNNTYLRFFKLLGGR